jgi:hypothetical protein
MTTAGIIAAIEAGWMIYIGEAVAITTTEISAASVEIGLDKKTIPGLERARRSMMALI